MSYPAISLSTATADRHRRPQKRLRPPANLPSTRIPARIIAPATPSPLFRCPHVSRRRAKHLELDPKLIPRQYKYIGREMRDRLSAPSGGRGGRAGGEQWDRRPVAHQIHIPAPIVVVLLGPYLLFVNPGVRRNHPVAGEFVALPGFRNWFPHISGRRVTTFRLAVSRYISPRVRGARVFVIQVVFRRRQDGAASVIEVVVRICKQALIVQVVEDRRLGGPIVGVVITTVDLGPAVEEIENIVQCAAHVDVIEIGGDGPLFIEEIPGGLNAGGVNIHIG